MMLVHTLSIEKHGFDVRNLLSFKWKCGAYDSGLVDNDLIAVEALHIIHYLGLKRVHLAGDNWLHL